MQQLLSEAAAGFRSDGIYLAFDGFTFSVPPRPLKAASQRPDGRQQLQGTQPRGVRGQVGERQLAARGQQQRRQWQQQTGDQQLQQQ